MALAIVLAARRQLTRVMAADLGCIKDLTMHNDLDAALPPTEMGQTATGTAPATVTDPALVKARLLSVVQELAQELQPHKGLRLDVRLDSDLDRERWDLPED